MPKQCQCEHSHLRLHEPSPHAATVGYRRPTRRRLTAAAAAAAAAATTRPLSLGDDSIINDVFSKRQKIARFQAAPAGKEKQAVIPHPDSTSYDYCFPAPLVIPGDDLAQDPRQPGQSLKEWIREEERNEVTSQRNVIYVAAPPEIDDIVEPARPWRQPQGVNDGADESEAPKEEISEPNVQAIVEYLTAFYHGLPVRLLEKPKFRFTIWGRSVKTGTEKGQLKAGSKPKKARNEIINLGLDIGTECVRIRTRDSKDGLFARQLNLLDLLDAAISGLPSDAYALVLLLNHDLYEDEDDDFCCGRAFGASRVCAVSTARYHPALDEIQDVEREHAWPASHCEDYVLSCSYENNQTRKRKATQPPTNRRSDREEENHLSPMQAAVTAYISSFWSTPQPAAQVLSYLWLSRVCRTVSHELGHCFGIDHCIYYACVMQGSATISEDARQPPYLCPVDLEKVVQATGADKEERYRALLDFCDAHGNSDTFSAFGAWIRCILTGS